MIDKERERKFSLRKRVAPVQVKSEPEKKIKKKAWIEADAGAKTVDDIFNELGLDGG
jgi:hypothetical protein